MSYYAIYAYENMYGGLHGINDYAVVEADSYEMAEKFAAELSSDVIDSYLDDEEIREAAGIDEDDVFFTDEDDKLDDFYAEDIAYDIYTLDESKIRDEISLNSYADKFRDDPHEFIEKYKAKGENEFYDSWLTI